MGENKIHTLKINGTPIERKRETNLLGLFINEHMNWNTHIFNISKTITKTLGVMNRLKHYLPQRILQILYNSLIWSHLNSNITAWGFASHKLCRLQKRALRLITDSRYNAHTQPLFKALCTLTLDDTFKMQCLKFYYKFIQGKLPPFFDTILLKKLPFIITKLAVEMISTFKPHIHQLLKIVLGTIFQNYCLRYQLGLQKKSTHIATLVSVCMWRNILLTNTTTRAALYIVIFAQIEYVNLWVVWMNICS